MSSYQDHALFNEFEILDGIFEWFGDRKRTDAAPKSGHLGGLLYRATAKEGQDPAQVRIHVGTVSVTALERVTREMLRSYSRGGVPAAIRAGGDEDLYHRVAGPGTSAYWPTLEPFLEFVLNRAIP